MGLVTDIIKHEIDGKKQLYLVCSKFSLSYYLQFEIEIFYYKTF